jgi:hypothetical protein
MLRTRLLVCLCLLSPLACSAEEIRLDNELADCAAVRLAPVAVQGNLATVEGDVELSKPIGDCACFSALARYTSSVEVEGVEQVLQQGLVNLKTGGKKTLVLASDPALIQGETAILALSCAPPL